LSVFVLKNNVPLEKDDFIALAALLILEI